MVERIRRLRARAGAAVRESSSSRLARVVATASRFSARTGTDRGGAIAHAIVHKAPRRVEGVSMAYEEVTFVLDLEDNLQRTLFYVGDYERPVFDLLSAELRHGDVVADIGANIGIHSLPLARRVAALAGTVLAFEAAVDTADLLRDLATLNDLAVEVHTVALGKERATAALHQSPNWDPGDLGVRSLFADGDVVQEVDVVPFDDWAEERGLHRLDIVKIDVEGAEHDVLLGMHRSLERYRPRLIVVEVVEWFLVRSGSSPAALDAFLQTHGYGIIGPTVAEIITGPTGPLWPNAVYRSRSG